MTDLSFKPTKRELTDLLRQCRSGLIQIPEFQREWVWTEDRVRGLLDSVIRGYPIGTLMILDAGSDANFEYRPIAGRSLVDELENPKFLLMDGQQRITSLYQASISENPTQVKDSKGNITQKWFYIDIKKSISNNIDRETIIFGVNENKSQIKSHKQIVFPDLSTNESEYNHFMFPISKIHNYGNWRYEFEKYWENKNGGKYYQDSRDIFHKFESEILERFSSYEIPVILLNELMVSKETICVIFEKVNTGGKPLEVSELLTAMYAGKGHNLRDDWDGNSSKEIPGLKNIFAKQNVSGKSVLSGLSMTDFLQAISLLYTRELSDEQKREHEQSKAVSGSRQALLDLPLDAYMNFEKKAQDGFICAAKFLQKNNIFLPEDIPYRTQVISLAVILSDIDKKWHQGEVYDKLAEWYWRGVFGGRYGSSSESMTRQDILQVPAWIDGGNEPDFLQDHTFQEEKLISASTKKSGMYKGVSALIMKFGARDFILGQSYAESVLFSEGLNIHHIFPVAWCEKNGIDKKRWNSIINKAPISIRTNEFLADDAPSEYLSRVQNGDSKKGIVPVRSKDLDDYLESHLIDPDILRTDKFNKFFDDRKKRLIEKIKSAMGD